MSGLGIYAGPLVHIVVVQGTAQFTPVRTDLLAFLGIVGGELGDLVLVVRAVQGNVPGEVAALDQIQAQVELDTGVHHVHVVDQLAGRSTLGDRQRTIVDHVLGLLDEVLDAEAEAVPQTALDTHVEVVGLLPGHVGSLAESLGEGGLTIYAVNPVKVFIYAVKADGIVTLCTVAGLEAQGVHPAGAAQELFVLGVPGSTHGPEAAPAFLGSEAGRSVHTVGSGEQVTVCVVVLGAAEDALQEVLGGRGGQVLIDGGIGKVGNVLVHEVGHVAVQAVALVALGLMADEDIEAVVAEGGSPGEELVGVECGVTGHRLLAAAAHVLGVTADRGLVLVALGVEHIVCGVHGEHQVRADVYIHITAGGDVVTDSADLGREQLAQRVHGRGVGTSGLTPVVQGLARFVLLQDAVLIIQVDGIDGGDILAPHEHVGVVVALRACIGLLVGVGIGHVQAGLEVLADAVVHLGTQGDTVEAGLRHVTIVAQVGGGHVGLGALGTAGSGYVVLLTDARTEDVAVPQVVPLQLLGSGVELAGSGIDDGIVGHALIDVVGAQHAEQVGGSVVAGLCQIHHVRVVHVVADGFPSDLIVLAGIGDDVVGRNGAGVHTHLGVEVDVHLAGLAALGGDDDDTVGTTGTVHGVGGCVLENGDGLDVLCGNGVQGTLIRHTVHDDKRAGGSAHGTETTDLDAGTGTRSTGGAGGHQTGHGTFQGLGHVGSLHLGEFLTAELGGGTGERRLLLNAVGYNDGLFQCLGVLFQEDIDIRAAADSLRNGDITDGGEFQRSIGRSVDCESAFHIGGCTCGGASHNYRSKRNTFTCCRILDGTPHSHVLCGEGHCQKHKDGAEEQFRFFHKLTDFS